MTVTDPDRPLPPAPVPSAGEVKRYYAGYLGQYGGGGQQPSISGTRTNMTIHSPTVPNGSSTQSLAEIAVADLDRFVDAVRRVADGGSALDPEVVGQLLGRRRRDDPLALLSPRERDVIELMAEGRRTSASPSSWSSPSAPWRRT